MDWTPAYAVVNTEQAIEPFLKTDRLSHFLPRFDSSGQWAAPSATMKPSRSSCRRTAQNACTCRTSSAYLSTARMAEGVVGLFQKKTLNDLIPIHPDNIGNKDWAILLEAGTIVGPSPQRIRVARCMQEKNILKKSDMLMRTFPRKSDFGGQRHKGHNVRGDRVRGIQRPSRPGGRRQYRGIWRRPP